MVTSLVIFICACGIALGQYTAPSFTYHDHDELTVYLRSVAREFPEMTDLYSIGTSVEGRELWVLSVAAQTPAHHVTLRPEVKYVGNMHGNEVVSRELLIHFIHHLVTEYNETDDVTALLNDARVHVLVSMNPDGFELAHDDGDMGTCVGVFGRYNANGLDLNRNFPDFFVHNTATIQPETRAIMEWLAAEQFVLSANLHGGALVANYPYDNNVPGIDEYTPTQDNDVFRHLTRQYSYTHTRMSQGSFCDYYFPDGITNGADWYPIIGGMQDYNYIYAGCMELTLEVSCCKYPNDTELSRYWDENRQALLTLLHQAFIGVKGVVTDGIGRPIKGAMVTVEGRDDHHLNTTARGEYWRLLLPGAYVLQVSTGYATKEVHITIPPNQKAPLIVHVQFGEDDAPTPSSGNAKAYSWALLMCLLMMVLAIGGPL